MSRLSIGPMISLATPSKVALGLVFSLLLVPVFGGLLFWFVLVGFVVVVSGSWVTFFSQFQYHGYGKLLCTLYRKKLPFLVVLVYDVCEREKIVGSS